jgi:hypothetical protein
MRLRVISRDFLELTVSSHGADLASSGTMEKQFCGQVRRCSIILDRTAWR